MPKLQLVDPENEPLENSFPLKNLDPSGLISVHGFTADLWEGARVNYDDLVKQAIDYLKKLPNANSKQKSAGKEHPFLRDHVKESFELKFPKRSGAKQVETIVKVLKDYAKNKTADTPISIAIFGPPGSGKSTFVRKISRHVPGVRLAKTANLTQVNHSDELVDALNEALQSVRETTDIPLVFFDEFDTMRNGALLGWLSWFLAPMEDGVMLDKGREIKIGKAVFVFAGGTAETLDAFTRRAKKDPEAYRARKVPDFLSRLRGAINIGGINEHGEDRILARTLALSHSLDAETARTLDTSKKLQPILENGYYVHGVRSLKTLLNAEKAGGVDKMDEVIRRQHFTRGEFDGLIVGISAGLGKNDRSQKLTTALTKQLLHSGATVAYAGAFFPEGTLDGILETARKAPTTLGTEKGARPLVVNYLGDPASQTQRMSEDAIFESRAVATLSDNELRHLGIPKGEEYKAFPDKPGDYNPAHHAAWAIGQFRLRVRVMQDVGALVVCGGKDDGKSWGRMSGIAEEVMIAIAIGRPIYVLGGAGGAAQAVGQLLGLHDAPVAREDCLTDTKGKGLEDLLKQHAPDFEIPGVADSPTTLADTRTFLFHRGIHSGNWRDNGLTVAENRTLFSMAVSTAKGANDATSVILQGLRGIDWKTDR